MAEGTGKGQAPDRDLALELVRVTEAAALAAARHMGRGDKIAVDKAAVDAMRLMLDSVSMRGTVVIGEGAKDEAPMLYNGEEVGNGTGPEVDVAVDPIEGTSLAANAQSRALSLVAVSERGTMFDPGPAFYMDKITAGEEARDLIDLDAPISDNLERVAKAKDTVVDELTVVILDRPRHEDLVRQVRETGARIKLISEGDVEASISAARPGTGVDLSIGVGGTPEGVITATALKCLGGVIQGRLAPQKDEERRAVEEAGIDTDRILTTDDLVRGDNCFFAMTGVTSGDILRGVQYRGTSATTQSMVMRSRSGTVRIIEALHLREKLKRIARILY